MRNKSSKKVWVSASDAGRAAFCPHYLDLKYKGTDISQQSKKLREQGDKAHEALNVKAESSVDPRCFISTFIFGKNGSETIAFRSYRDRTLNKSIIGRLIVSIYYFTSPLFVQLLKGCPLLIKPVRRLLKILLMLINNEGQQ